MAGVSPARAAFQDITNDLTPQKASGKEDASTGDETPPQSWTAGDQFQFVEEDDDEVLFRVCESGVLRSHAFPGLSQPSVVSPPHAFNADETLEQKQVPPTAHPRPIV
jgi:hypothetical protein